MFLRSTSRRIVQEDNQETIEETKQRLVAEVFGGNKNVEEELPSPEKIIALIWLYQEDEEVLEFLCNIIEKHAMQKPSLVDNIENYLPQLIQLALQWKPPSEEEEEEEGTNTSTNKVERTLLILAQLSTRFAIQYHWSIQNLLEDLQLDCTKSGRPNNDFDMEYYANCMMLSGDLERCMMGQRQPIKAPKIVPKLEITASYGGAVTTDEVHDMTTKDGDKETSKEFFDAIVATAQDNVSSGLSPGQTGSVAALDTPLKLTFGGVLFFKRVYRKGVRRNKWKERYFALEESMLNCYSRERKLLRSMSLEGASIWKGIRHDKYPHSFVVTNRNAMFHLRATSEEQKSAWKHKIRDAIMASSNLPKNLPESQKQRYENYKNAKWFGRMLTDITNDLDYAQPDERHQLLEDSLFELDIPQDGTLHWPWKEHGGSSEKSVFVALPHFSGLVDARNGKRWKTSSPSFQASFMVKRDESLVMSRPYERFLEEGRQADLEGAMPLPDEIQFALQNSPWPSTDEAGNKEVDTDSTEGNSTDGSSSTDSNSTGNEVYDNEYSTSASSDDDGATGEGSDGYETDGDSDGSEDSDESRSCGVESVQFSTIIPITRQISELTTVFREDSGGNAKPKEKNQTGETGNEQGEVKPSSSKTLSKSDGANVDVTEGDDPASGRVASAELTKAANKAKALTTGDSVAVELVLKEPSLKVNKTTKQDNESNDQPQKTGGAIEKGGSNALPDAAARRLSLFENSSARRSSFFDDDDSEDSLPFDYTMPTERQKGLTTLQTKQYRQEEVLAAQLGQYYQSLFETSKIWIRAPRVRRMSRDMMIAEVPRRGVVTLEEAKDSLGEAEGGDLLDYFIATHGPEGSESFQRAQTCFAQSLAGMFLLSYLLGAKNDRNDENLMLDKRGHIFALDYSSSLFKSPRRGGGGKKACRFKLTEEYLAIMGGMNSPCYENFRSLLVAGLKKAQEDIATPIGLLQLVPGNFLCGDQRDDAVHHLRKTLLMAGLLLDSSADFGGQDEDDDDDDTMREEEEHLSNNNKMNESMRIVIEQPKKEKRKSSFRAATSILTALVKS